MSLLTMMQAVTKELGLTVPTAVVNSGSNTIKQLLALSYEVADEAKLRFVWPVLTRQTTITFVANQANYTLPTDFDYLVFETMWNRAENWFVDGPLSAQEWQARENGIATSSIRDRYRIKGIDDDQFYIYPTPTSKAAGAIRAWVGNTSTLSFDITGDFTGTSALDYRVKIDGVATPNTFTWSDDGGTTWDASGVAITGAAQVLNNGFSITFSATTGGVLNDYWDFASGETVVFEYQSTNWIRPPTWANATAYLTGGYCFADGVYYLCSSGGTSSGTSPTDDVGATWSVYTGIYDSYVADSDISLLHERSVMGLGLKWMWKEQKGLPYQIPLMRWEDQIRRRSVSKNGASTLNMAHSGGRRFLGRHNIPDGDYGP